MEFLARDLRAGNDASLLLAMDIAPMGQSLSVGSAGVRAKLGIEGFIMKKITLDQEVNRERQL